MGRDYDSILFNTAQVYRVSYLTEAESAEVLTRPARGILEYDPAALAQAYRLSRGQPLVLQSLGATLIQQFNSVVFNGGERSDYVSTFDLRPGTGGPGAGRAARQSGLRESLEGQRPSDPATHKALSALAWATINRVSVDIHGIAAAIDEQGLKLDRHTLGQIVERLVEEEVLERAGSTYGFAVPLYGRWLRWRWPPRRVLDMG